MTARERLAGPPVGVGSVRALAVGAGVTAARALSVAAFVAVPLAAGSVLGFRSVLSTPPALAAMGVLALYAVADAVGAFVSPVLTAAVLADDGDLRPHGEAVDRDANGDDADDTGSGAGGGDDADGGEATDGTGDPGSGAGEGSVPGHPADAGGLRAAVGTAYPALARGTLASRVVAAGVSVLALPVLAAAYLPVGTAVEFGLHTLGAGGGPLDPVLVVLPVLGVGLVGVPAVRWAVATVVGDADLAALSTDADGARAALSAAAAGARSDLREAARTAAVVGALRTAPFLVGVGGLIALATAGADVLPSVAAALGAFLLVGTATAVPATRRRVRAHARRAADTGAGADADTDATADRPAGAGGGDPAGADGTTGTRVGTRAGGWRRYWPGGLRVAVATLLVVGLAAGGAAVRVGDVGAGVTAASGGSGPSGGTAPPGSPGPVGPDADPKAAAMAGLSSLSTVDHVLVTRRYRVGNATGEPNRTPAARSGRRFDADDGRVLSYFFVGGSNGSVRGSYRSETVRARLGSSVPLRNRTPAAAVRAATDWRTQVARSPGPVGTGTLRFRLSEAPADAWTVLRREDSTVVVGLRNRTAYDAVAPYVPKYDEDTPVRGTLRVYLERETGRVTRIEESFVYDRAVRDDERDPRRRARVSVVRSYGDVDVSRPPGLGPPGPGELLADLYRY